jgi:hypothetical protein
VVAFLLLTIYSNLGWKRLGFVIFSEAFTNLFPDDNSFCELEKLVKCSCIAEGVIETNQNAFSSELNTNSRYCTVVLGNAYHSSKNMQEFPFGWKSLLEA